MAIPKKADQRIQRATRRYQKIIAEAKARDVNEADTVTIVKAMLADVFGWDPFFEVTSEYAIRSTFVDLAVKAEDHVVFLVEVKAIGNDLKETHLRQAVGYAANHGVDWVVLTNGTIWQGHFVGSTKPIKSELVFEIDFLTINPREIHYREAAFLLTKEGMTRSAIDEYHEEKVAMSRFNIATILQSDEVVKIVRRELKRAFPGLKPDLERLHHVIANDVLKREVVVGEKAKLAEHTMRKAAKRALRQSSKERR